MFDTSKLVFVFFTSIIPSYFLSVSFLFTYSPFFLIYRPIRNKLIPIKFASELFSLINLFSPDLRVLWVCGCEHLFPSVCPQCFSLRGG